MVQYHNWLFWGGNAEAILIFCGLKESKHFESPCGCDINWLPLHLRVGSPPWLYQRPCSLQKEGLFGQAGAWRNHGWQRISDDLEWFATKRSLRCLASISDRQTSGQDVQRNRRIVNWQIIVENAFGHMKVFDIFLIESGATNSLNFPRCPTANSLNFLWCPAVNLWSQLRCLGSQVPDLACFCQTGVTRFKRSDCSVHRHECSAIPESCNMISVIWLSCRDVTRLVPIDI